MKTIYKIAKTELQTLFYSPVAWLVIVIFTFQTAMTFTNMFGGLVRNPVSYTHLTLPTTSRV